MAKEVDMFEIARAESPEKLSTTPLGPCLGACFYHPKTRTGYLGHIPAPACDTTWSDLVDIVLREYETPAEVEVTLTGLQLMAPDPEYGIFPEQGTEQREYIVKYLAERGFDQQKIRKRFNNKHFGVITHFYLKSGKVITEPLEEDYW